MWIQCHNFKAVEINLLDNTILQADLQIVTSDGRGAVLILFLIELTAVSVTTSP